MGISKRGNTYLRTLLIHGARAALPSLCESDTPLGRWLKAMLERGVHRNAVVVALANKLARIAWATLRKETTFERGYVQALAKAIPEIVPNYPIRTVSRTTNGVDIAGHDGHRRHFDHVVIATHADQALAMLADPSAQEQRLLGSFSYVRNDAILHSDSNLMPRRRRVWSSWNYMSRGASDSRQLAVTYWMNRLQGIADETPLFVTLNPHRDIDPGSVLRRLSYRHPRFDCEAMAAQEQLWSLQGMRRTWYCGAYFGAGFHEDGLQAGLAVAEAVGGVRRPWSVREESGRIHLHPVFADATESEAA